MKFLFWDFDGTLAFSRDNFWSNVIYDCAMKAGYDRGFEILYKKVNEGRLFSWDFKDVSYEERVNLLWWDDFEERLSGILKECKMDEQSAKKAARSVRSCILDASNYSLYEDSDWILNKAKELGYTNIIVSNNYPELKEVMEQLGIAQYFEEFIISGQVGYEKPHRGIFELALKGKNPKDCWMIGDNPIADIKGAKQFGLKTILVHREKPNKCETDFCFETLKEIEKVLS